MKKILVSAFAAAASAAAFAGINNVVIRFSTPGDPADTYSDGTTVRDGEKYALVWTPNGSDFAGINSNGEAVPPSKVVVARSLASGGKCPPVQFQVDEAVVTNKYNGGFWSVVLLDTRKFQIDEESGKPVVTAGGDRIVESVAKDDNPIIGYSVVSTANVAVGVDADVLSGTEAAFGEAASDTPAPVVESIDVSGDSVIVTVSRTRAPFKYRLISGETPDAVKDVVEGDESSDFGSKTQDIITLKMPKEDGVKFFKVNCK